MMWDTKFRKKTSSKDPKEGPHSGLFMLVNIFPTNYSFYHPLTKKIMFCQQNLSCLVTTILKIICVGVFQRSAMFNHLNI